MTALILNNIKTANISCLQGTSEGLFSRRQLIQMSYRSSSSVRGTQVVWGCMALALFLHVSSGSPANRSPSLLSHHHLAKRSFFDLQCRGVYDKSIFARLDRICVDCYNLFRETAVHSLCRENCFTTDIFKGGLGLNVSQPKFSEGASKVYWRWKTGQN
ncbi:hypothetical protein JTB14_017291 [Gonioctena quinquepunctata]|nr:hypothetical protein JTB14_017291 [Gonioctena quinquepunctata]